MDISIVIPTYNRADSLVQALKSAMALDYPSDRYEIIVVDNASTDATPQVVTRLQGGVKGCSLRYVQEEQLGLHNARHAGARAANGKILVFTDDDAAFDPGWLQAYTDAFDSHPEMAAAGGPVRPLWETLPPKWLLDYMSGRKTFGIMSLMEPYREFRLDTRGFFFGVNMAIRRDVLFQVGGFNPELIGRFTVGDGESGLVRKIQERGWPIGYVPGALVYHHIPSGRMTLDYLCRWQAHGAGTRLYCRYHKHMPGNFGIVMDALRMVLLFTKTWVRAGFVRSRTDRLSVSLQIRGALGYAQLRYVIRLIFDGDLRQMVTRKDWLKPNSATLETQPRT